jgi:hypothetical protein
VRGFIAITVRSIGSMSSASRQPPGGSGWRRKASVSPTARSWCGSRSMPQATRSTVPNRLTSTGMSKPVTVSNSTAGPCSASRPGLDLGHLQHRRDRRLDAHQPARLFQPGHEVAERGVGHGVA